MQNIDYEKKNKSLSRKLRKEMTKEERHLWYDFLSSHTCTFSRQKPIGNYIIDFFCSSKKLAIELDGSQHYIDDGLIKDAIRTEFLCKQGIKVLRFANIEIANNFSGCCAEINKFLDVE